MNNVMFKYLFPIVAILCAITTPLLANPEASPLKKGDKAPRVEGIDQDGKTWRLSDFAARKAVLFYFYPKDDTPGCTAQACGWRDTMEDLKSKDVEVVGVSFDSTESHQRFKEKHHLNFTLLSDPSGKIADAFSARKAPDQNMARRISFLIDKTGVIRAITDNPSAAIHLEEMKKAIEALKTP